MQDQTKNDAENAEPVYDKAFYLELFSQVHDHVAKNFRTLFNKREIERLDAFSNAPRKHRIRLTRQLTPSDSLPDYFYASMYSFVEIRFHIPRFLI
jgi:hypothetical protein